jgi:hypothetical protein
MSLDMADLGIERAQTIGFNNVVSIVDSAYNEYELDTTNNCVKKQSKGISNKYNNEKYYGQKDVNGKRHLISTDSNIDILLDTKGISSGAEILGYDQDGSMYALVIDMANTSKVVMESTVRKYDKSGNPAGIARIPNEQCYGNQGDGSVDLY